MNGLKMKLLIGHFKIYQKDINERYITNLFRL